MESCSSKIRQICRDRGWWDDRTPFDWKACVGYGVGATLASDYRLEIRGREKAGADHLRKMSDQLSCGDMHSDDAPVWVRCMSDALRDEDSGICFRDSYGFCSTGSQISWIPPNSSKNSSDLCDATHFFTAASDPLVASYKRFVFKNAEEGGGGMTNYGTLELWHRWREIALQGGLKRCYSRDDKDKIKKVMQEAEVQAFSAITSGSDIHQIDLSFKSAVEQELALLGTKKP
eukprot:15327159-Ditylum_brightwellii.AAC.1